MPTHMVIFRSAEGKPGFHQTDGLDEAIRFVEHLRNVEQVPDAHVYKLTEVPLEVKTYFKIEVADDGAAPVGAARPAAEATSPSAPLSTPRASAEPAGANDDDEVDAPAKPVAVGGREADGEARGAMPGPIANGGSTARFGRFNRG